MSRCVALLSSCRASWLLSRLPLRCPLDLSPPSRRHLVFSPHLSSSSHCTALSSYHCVGWLLPCLSLRHRLVLSLHRPLILSSSSQCTALSSSNRAGWLLRRLSSRHRLVFLSRHTLVLLSSSHCAALLSSHRAVWLLRCLSSHWPLSRPLIVLSLRHPLVVLCRLVAVLPLVAPPSRPLAALPSCPLIVRRKLLCGLHQTMPPPLNAPPTADIAHRLHRPPPPPPPPNTSPSCIDKERGSTTTTTSVPMAAPS